MNTGIISVILLSCVGLIASSAIYSDGMDVKSRQLRIPSLEFTLDLYRTLRDASPNKNIFYSPWSIAVGLSMVLNGAELETATELLTALKLPPGADVNAVNQKLASVFQSLTGNEVGYELESANALYVNESFPVHQQFLDVLTQTYNAPPQQLDFSSQNEVARQTINEYVSCKTRSLIPELIPQGGLSPNTVMYLLNAVYFAGKWEHEFPLEDTRTEPFYTITGNPVDVQMMRLEEELHITYQRDLNTDTVLLPYQGSRLRMLLLVPRERFGIVDLEKKITGQLLSELLHMDTKTHRGITAILKMPKFKTETDTELTDVLNMLNVRKMFTNQAELTKITDKPVKVSSVIHKAVLEVDEQGTKAAAATGVSFVTYSLSFGATAITLDHPFLLFIHDTETDAVLFAGAILSL